MLRPSEIVQGHRSLVVALTSELCPRILHFLKLHRLFAFWARNCLFLKEMNGSFLSE